MWPSPNTIGEYARKLESFSKTVRKCSWCDLTSNLSYWLYKHAIEVSRSNIWTIYSTPEKMPRINHEPIYSRHQNSNYYFFWAKNLIVRIMCRSALWYDKLIRTSFLIRQNNRSKVDYSLFLLAKFSVSAKFGSSVIMNSRGGSISIQQFN
jgi:hypothetical protein